MIHCYNPPLFFLLYTGSKNVSRLLRVKYLIAGHDRDKILGLRKIDNAVRPAGNHMYRFDLVAGHLKFHRFTGIDVALPDPTMPGNNNEQLPLGIVPMLPFRDTRTAEVDRYLSESAV